MPELPASQGRLWRIRGVWRWVRPSLFTFVNLFVAMVAASFLRGAYPYVFGLIIDEVILHRQVELLGAIAVGFLMLFVADQVLFLLERLTQVSLQRDFWYRSRLRIHDVVLRLESHILDTSRTSDLFTTIHHDSGHAHRMLGEIIRIISGCVLIAVCTAAVATISWHALVLMAVTLPASAYATRRFGGKAGTQARELRSRYGVVGSWIYEIITGLPEIRLLSAEATVNRRFVRHWMQLIRFKVGVARAMFTSERWTEAISLIAHLALLGMGVLLFGSGELTVGGFVALVEYFAMTKAVLVTINFAGVMSQQRVAGIDRYLGTLELPTEAEGTSVGRRVERGAIRFDEVTFGYAGRNDVLTGLSLDVTAGENIALVGASGAGKSTIISLLLRFYHPSAGRIELDGSDLASYPLPALRRDIGVVRQEPILFTGTLRSNLCLGIEIDQPDEALWAACEAAKIDDFVRSLPDRLDTVVGAGGRQMSGGQRQRLAIARVLLRDSRILVFDEATSAIDHQAETAIHAALTHASAGRTTIVIAHRQSTIRSSERIAFLAGGRVAAVGLHEELHATCPEYRIHFGAVE